MRGCTGAGSLSTEQATQSLRIFDLWDGVFGGQARARVRRVANLMPGYSLGPFGADLAKIDAVTTPATFGRMCPSQPCGGGLVELDDPRAPFVFSQHSVDDMLDVIRSLVLAAEVGWNQVHTYTHTHNSLSMVSIFFPPSCSLFIAYIPPCASCWLVS